MFIYNLKFSKKAITRIFICLALVIITGIVAFSCYLIFFKSTKNVCNEVKNEDVLYLHETNYTDILKAANDNIDLYVGQKVHVTGYVYRLLDFNKNQFVVARDMRFNENSEALVVGFLCEYSKASDFVDGTWVEVLGEITKSNFNGEIAVLNIISIKETSKPENPFVSPPSKTFIPTSSIFN